MSQKKTERRQARRFALSCPVKLTSHDGKIVAQTEALNISDGGMFLSLPVKSLPVCGGSVKLRFSVPRFTPNTYVMEDFTCDAQVVRHQPLIDEAYGGAALQFETPVDLALEA